MNNDMNPAIIIGLALVQYGPALARALAEIFTKSNPTIEEWEAVFKLAETPYDDYVKPKG